MTKEEICECGHEKELHWNAPRIDMFHCRYSNCKCKQFKPQKNG